MVAECFDYKAFHIVKAEVKVSSQARVQLALSGNHPPFVMVKPVPDNILRAANANLVEFDFDEIPILKAELIRRRGP